MRWVDATQLSQWGERRDGQGDMPELLRRLIYAAKGPRAVFRFPSGDSVQLPGWDGFCHVEQGDAFVPAGTSVWEIGAQRDGIRAKANSDYVKRTSKPRGLDPAQTAFVFVTPHRFPNKDIWLGEKRAENKWGDIRVLDGDDLAAWLEIYPAVSQWLATKVGLRPTTNLRGLEESWQEWVEATEMPLSADLILVDRDEDATAILRWAKSDPALISVQADAPDEAIAFLFAALRSLPEPHRLSFLSRCVIAPDANSARSLVGGPSRLYIGLVDSDPGLAQRLVQDGHHVYAAVSGEMTASVPNRCLARPWSHNLEDALIQLGAHAQDAHQWARGAGRSVTVLRRIMPAALASRPSWAVNPPAELLAAMLAGGWDERSDKDRSIVAAISNRPYEEVDMALGPIAAIVGGPLHRSGSFWKITSLRDVWSLLAPRLTTSQLERFKAAFQEVLGSVSREYDAPPSLIRSYTEPKDEFSGVLRRGVTESMIALGVYPDRARCIPSAAAHAHQAIAWLLSSADAKLWWSLSRDFRRLAEASPTAFLDSVQQALEGKDKPLLSLFRRDEGVFGSTEYLSELLWTLEMLARSPDYLAPSALLLAHLDTLDDDDKRGNRPATSLRQIFVPWSPETYATLEERLKVIDSILRQFPDAGWKLLLSLAPRAHDSTEPSPQPEWRDFNQNRHEAPDRDLEFRRSAQEIGRRLLDHGGTSGARWRSLIGLWSSFGSRWRSEAAAKLADYAKGEPSPKEQEALRDGLRKLLSQHRNFAGADWAMPADVLAPLDEIFRSLEPTSPAERYRWLFKDGPDLLRPDHSIPEMNAELDALHRGRSDGSIVLDVRR
jgi:hypothetical protein